MKFTKSDKEDWNEVWKEHKTKNSYNFYQSRIERSRNKVSTFIENGIKFQKDELILEAGCGDGSVIFSLLENFDVNCVGLDFSENAMMQAEKIMKERKQYFEFDLGDVHNMKYNDYTFDKVISLGVIEHFNDPEKIIKEMYRVLKKDGVLIIMTPNKYSIGVIDRLIKQFFHKWPFGFQTEYSTSELKFLCSKCGIEHMKISTQLRPSMPNDSNSFKIISFFDQIINAIKRNFGFYSYIFITK